MMPNNSRSAFTLVELSIVLIIIGLLIGGILIGQTMVDSAKVQSVIREVEQYKIATRLFKNQFGQLPGDYNKGTTLGSGASGNGDGVINCSWSEESINAFYELTASGFLKGKLTSPANLAEAPIVNGNVMGSSTLKDSFFWVASSVNTIDVPTKATMLCTGGIFGNVAEDKIGDNYFALTRIYPTGPQMSRSVYGVEPIFAKALDAKSDDGRAATGDVRTGIGLDGANWQLCVNVTGGDYSTSTYIEGKPAFEPDLGCGVIFKIRD